MEKEHAYYMVDRAVAHLRADSFPEAYKNIDDSWEYVRDHAKRTFIGGLVIGSVIGFGLGMLAVCVFIDIVILK